MLYICNKEWKSCDSGSMRIESEVQYIIYIWMEFSLFVHNEDPFRCGLPSEETAG